MRMTKDDVAELEKQIAKARKKPIAFGLCLGKKPDNNILYLDLIKPPEVVARQAKKDGETGKVTFGTASVAGKIIDLSIQGKMLPGLAKNMRLFLAKCNIKMKVVISDPNGDELETAEDEEEAAGPPDLPEEQAAQADQDAPQEEPQQDDPMMAKWAQLATALDPFVSRFAASGHEKAAAVAAAWNGAKTAAKKVDYKSALAVAAKIKPLVTSAPQESTQAPTEPVDPDAARWAALQNPMEALYTRALKNNPANRSQLEAAWGAAQEKAAKSDYKSALAVASKLKPHLDTAAQAQTTGQDQEIPENIVAFQKSHKLWVTSLEKIHTDIATLENAIRDSCANDPELQPFADEASTLSQRIKVFDDSLEGVLDQITNSSDKAQRQALTQQAADLVQQYKDALNDPFFADVDDNNGFVKVSVAATARASLNAISKVLTN